VKQLTLQHGALLALAALAASTCVEAQSTRHASTGFASGTISGIIRDADGIPQMGALVQAILPDSSLAGSAITDARGRYRIFLQPGSYRIRATAALFMPAIREHLAISGGTRSVVDLTLATLMAPSGWLPASRRTTAEPSDDWMWTLRSSASRPILRFIDPPADGKSAAGNSDSTESADAGISTSNSGALTISSSSQEARRGVSGGRVTIKNSDGGFARGGNHNILVLTRVNEDGSGTVLRADMSGARTPYPVSPSAVISVGMERRTPLNGYSRAVITYSNHPEITDGRGVTGMQGATVRSAQRIELGDLVRVDAGSVMRDSNLGGNALAIEPFIRVAAHVSDAVVLAYGMTRSRGVEGIEDLDRVQAAVPVAVMRNGHLRLEGGSHHALSATGKLPGGGAVEVAIYRDDLVNPLITGTGVLNTADLQTSGLVADPTTATYRVAAQNYTSAGLRVSMRQPVTKSLNVGAEYASGEALRAARMQYASMSELLGNLSPSRIYAATAYADGKILHTGTTVRASYRWQPETALTAVDAFRLGDDGAYLSCSIRQSLGKTHFLPQGLEAVVDIQNLLAQGYQPFLSNDGQTLYLAQTPKTVQAGLSFTF
jgi:hypothetical protein